MLLLNKKKLDLSIYLLKERNGNAFHPNIILIWIQRDPRETIIIISFLKKNTDSWNAYTNISKERNSADSSHL